MAAIWGKIGRIVFCAGRNDVHRMYFEDRHLDGFDFIADAFRDDLTIIGGVLAAECTSLYYGPDDKPPLGNHADTWWVSRLPRSGWNRDSTGLTG